jgi:hypothetical protein
MNLRYLGFEQRQNARAYQFDSVEKGQPSRQFVVTADLALFLTYRVGLQEGPALSASKLTADLENNVEGEHQLTAEDLRAFAAARLLADAARAEKRTSPRRNSATPSTAQQPSSWRNFSY